MGFWGSYIKPLITQRSERGRGNTTTTQTVDIGRFDKKKPLLYSLRMTPQLRFDIEMEDWRVALYEARNPTLPQRAALYEMYESTRIDDAVKHEIRLATVDVQSAPFRILNKNGKEQADLQKLFKKSWFQNYLKLALECEFFGHTVIDFEPKPTASGEVDSVRVLPREHVRPQMGEVLAWSRDTKGIAFEDLNKAGFRLFPLGDVNDLGLMETGSQLVIRKGYANKDWSTKNEKFGMPYVALMVSTDNENELQRREQMLAGMGANNYGIFRKDDDEIHFIEPKDTANGHKTYEDFINQQNSRLALLFNGQTGASNEKSFVGSAEVHERTMGKFTLSRLRAIQNDVNDKLFPFLTKYYPTYQLDGSELNFTELDEKKPLPVEKPKDTEGSPNPPAPPKPPSPKPKGGSTLTKQLSDLYTPSGSGATVCCDLHAADAPRLTKLSTSLNDIFEKTVLAVFQKKIKAGQLDKSLWDYNVKELTSGLNIGFGSEYTADKTQPDFVKNLTKNVGVAMAFKNWHNMNDMAAALVDESGEPRTFEQFREVALGLDAQYNQSWLLSEFQLATRSATMAVEWERLKETADLLPNLRYVTVGDKRVREAHKKMDGIVVPMNDPYWDLFYPPNGWGCRCTIEPTDDDAKEPDYTPDETQVPKVFRQNVGKTGEVFSEDHPYFDLKPSDKKTILGQIKKWENGE
jgi:SPP1 gp7 family putative phage head morphogenesis protein